MMPSPAIASLVCLQDWDGWMNEGIVDFVVPMLYVTSSTTQTEVSGLLSYKHSRHMYIGVGNYQLPKETAAQQIRDASTAGAEGTVLFSYHYLVADTENHNPIRVTDLKTSVFAQPAAVPAMPWKGGSQ